MGNDIEKAASRALQVGWRWLRWSVKALLLLLVASFTVVPTLGLGAVFVMGSAKLYEIGGCRALPPVPPLFDDQTLFATLVCQIFY